MASKDQIDQDALAAEWGLALDAETSNSDRSPVVAADAEEGEAAASQWSALVDDTAAGA